MATMEDLFSEAGIPWGDFTPGQQFAGYATQQFRPGPSPMRSAFWEYQQPLTQQWFLNQPTEAMGLNPYGSFADYMGTYGSPTDPMAPSVYSTERTRRLAEQAAAVAGLTGGQFFQYVDPQEGYEGPAIAQDVMDRLGAMTPGQRLMYRMRYGTGEQAAENQFQLANMMALQRPTTQGGGYYGRALGGAIQSALGELQGQLRLRDPGANFLDWYLQRTQRAGGDPGLGGFMARTPTGPTALEELAISNADLFELDDAAAAAAAANAQFGIGGNQI